MTMSSQEEAAAEELVERQEPRVNRRVGRVCSVSTLLQLIRARRVNTTLRVACCCLATAITATIIIIIFTEPTVTLITAEPIIIDSSTSNTRKSLHCTEQQLVTVAVVDLHLSTRFLFLHDPRLPLL